MIVMRRRPVDHESEREAVRAALERQGVVPGGRRVGDAGDGEHDVVTERGAERSGDRQDVAAAAADVDAAVRRAARGVR